MEFCIATVEYWQSVGFDRTNWRKSVDGTKAMVHSEYAKVLVDVENNPNVEVYLSPSREFTELLSSDEWTEKGEEEWL